MIKIEIETKNQESLNRSQLSASWQLIFVCLCFMCVQCAVYMNILPFYRYCVEYEYELCVWMLAQLCE